MKTTNYEIKTDKLKGNITLAVVSDLHARPFKEALDAINDISPDAILLPGDIVEIAADYMDVRNQNGLGFLREAARLAPTYYCYGNHEIYYSHAKGNKSKTPDNALGKKYLEAIRSYGVHVINDASEALDVTASNGNTSRIMIGGLVCGRDMDPALNSPMPDLDFLEGFDNAAEFKILLCHYPQYFERFVKQTDIDLTLSGHAHGGQWRIFGRGVYAPHQGIFPKYTSGMHDGRHIISRGAANNVKPIPRFFNPCEILKITIIGL